MTGGELDRGGRGRGGGKSGGKAPGGRRRGETALGDVTITADVKVSFNIAGYNETRAINRSTSHLIPC